MWVRRRRIYKVIIIIIIMKKSVLILFLVIGIFGIVFLVSAKSTLNFPGGVLTTETEEITIGIEKGWNLVHGFAHPDWIISGDISSNNIQSIYAFNSQTQEYVQFFPNSDDKISKSNFRWDSYTSQNAF